MQGNRKLIVHVITYMSQKVSGPPWDIQAPTK